MKNITNNLYITGSNNDLYNTKVIESVLGKYTLKIRVTLSNEFLGIEEIKINKEFASYKSKITPKGYHDVSKYYEE